MTKLGHLRCWRRRLAESRLRRGRILLGWVHWWLVRDNVWRLLRLLGVGIRRLLNCKVGGVYMWRILRGISWWLFVWDYRLRLAEGCWLVLKWGQRRERRRL